jgi:hypothetical protein
MKPRNRARRVAAIAIGVLIVAPLVTAGVGWIVQHLWNWLMPTIFALKAITFWQALGLMFLSWILFGGRRGLSAWSGNQRQRRRRMWERLTPEQRAELLGKMKGRCAADLGAEGASDPIG